MDSKHTPGPWMAYWEHEGGPLMVGAGTNCTVALMYWPPSGDKEANGRLVAAAPDLLDALRNMRDTLKAAGYATDHADAAIARATGAPAARIESIQAELNSVDRALAQPLTEERLGQLWRDSPFRGNGGQRDWFIEGARAAERVHGIAPKGE